MSLGEGITTALSISASTQQTHMQKFNNRTQSEQNSKYHPHKINTIQRMQ